MGNLLSTPQSNIRSPSQPGSTSINLTTTAREASALINSQLGTGHTMTVHTTAVVAATTNTARTSLDTLPMEMVELISSHLPALKDISSLRLVSCTLRRKSEYVFGTRYFANIKIFMHASNIRALSELSTMRMASYVQVIGVQLPHTTHTALRPGLVDPMHDPNAPNNSISRGPNGETHNDTSRPVKTLAELTTARVTADIISIKQALSRMPKLREVRTGNFADEHLRGLRAVLQIPQQETIRCVQGHCRPNIWLSYEQMYHIIVAAVAGIHRPAGEEEVNLSIAVNSFSPRIDLSSSTIALLAKMKTKAQISFDEPEKITHCYWLSDASPEGLELRYRRRPDNTFPAIALPLKSIAIFQGCFAAKCNAGGLTAALKPMTANLIAFLDHHASSLETVRLLRCRMSPGDAKDLGMWKPVLAKLKEMPKLVVLELQYLESEPANGKNHLDEEAGKNGDVVLHWQWRKEKVQEAVRKLEDTYQTVEVQGYTYLNLHAGT